MEGGRLEAFLERLHALMSAERRMLSSGRRLQPVHASVLSYLSRCNRYSNTPAGVSQFLGTTKGTVSQSLLLLEREGLIRKSADRKDGRVQHLSLTARGRRIVRALTTSSPAEKLTRRERAAAERALSKLLLELQRRNQYRTFGECRSCRHLLAEGRGGYRCGLTREPLRPDDTELICVEHEPPEAVLD